MVRASRKRLTAMVVAVVVLMLAGGVAVSLEERPAQNDRYRSMWEGLWWAVGTVTTVGYGDVAPTTAVGRLVGGLALSGIVGVVIVTAGLALAVVLDVVRGDRRPVPPAAGEHPAGPGRRLSAIVRRWPWLRALVRRLHDRWLQTSHNRYVGIASVTASLILFCGAAVYVVEKADPNDSFHSVWDGLWWAVVTVTTVGYGDFAPRTGLGRLIGSLLMFTGIGLLSIMTASVASALVSEGLKEARGLETIRTRGHLLICGWNDHAERLIESLEQLAGVVPEQLVLVNQLPEEAINEVLFKYRHLKPRYVRGDFCHEAVLDRANVRQAQAAIILADLSAGTAARADERTILATLAVKNLNANVRVSGELLDGQNEAHLRRANADEIVVAGEHNPFLLSAGVASPGLTQAVRTILGQERGLGLQRVDIPASLVGGTFGELAADFRRNEGLLVLGVITEQKGMRLEEMLGHDTSSIDEFIRRKFAEAGLEHRAWGGGGLSVIMNPDDSRIISSEDAAVVLGRIT